MELIKKIKLLTSVSNIPITYFNKDALIYSSPNFPNLNSAVDMIVKKAFDFSKCAEMSFTNELLCFAYIKEKETDNIVVFGPLSAISCDITRVNYLLRSYVAPISESLMLYQYFLSVPLFSLQQFSDFFSLAYFVLCDDEIDLGSTVSKEYIEQLKIVETTVESKNRSVVHTGRDFEDKLFGYIESGLVEELKDFLQNAPRNVTVGTLAGDGSRQNKNTLISSTLLASRHAVNGGLDYDMAMTIADSFFQKIEFTTDKNALSLINGNMLVTFAKKVADAKMNFPITSIPYKVKSFIEKNITNEIKVADVAKELNLSRSYLSTIFKKDVGYNLNDYITMLKIEEAKVLLSTTNLTAVAIANNLAFSSQSYFQYKFKKVTGLTPKEYKKTKAFL